MKINYRATGSVGPQFQKLSKKMEERSFSGQRRVNFISALATELNSTFTTGRCFKRKFSRQNY